MPATVLMITHNPFWRRDRGSRQRIDALARAIWADGFELALCFVGRLDGDDRRRAHAMPFAALEVSGRDAEPHGPPPSLRGFPLDAFRSGAARAAFDAQLARVCPDVVLVQQIRHAWLPLEMPAGRRAGIRLAIDTHDVMHERCASFAGHGREHWLDIDRAAEARVLASFDDVIAIQASDGATLAGMVEPARVVTAPHAPEMPWPAPPPPALTGTPIRLGFIGCAGHANADAGDRLARAIVPALRARANRDVRLVLAGAAAERIAPDVDDRAVERLGHVDDLGGFFASIDVVVNPVRFGGGLKIKNVEALAHARPLVTTPVGAQGIEAGAGTAFLVADDDDACVATLAELLDRPALARDVAACGRAFAEAHFTPEHAFAPLLARWRAGASRRHVA